MSCNQGPSCEQRHSLDYIPNTAATIGSTFDGITDTLDLTDAIHNVEAKTRVKLNRTTGNLEHWNEEYIVTENEATKEVIPVAELGDFLLLENIANVETRQPKAGDLLYYVADKSCGPDCEGVNDSWVKLRAPEDDGKYHLTMTVTDGVPRLSWEKA